MGRQRQRAARRRAKDKQSKRSQTATENDLLYRSATVLVDTRGDKPTIGLAFSSEEPVERYDFQTGDSYREILSHDPADVDLSRASDGLPLLVDHNGPQVGLVRGVAVGNDGKLRGTISFGAHPDAEWIRKDMIDGIRLKVSVGYRLGDEIGERDGNSRRFQWQPLEVSSVSIPADQSVGIGRGNQTNGMGEQVTDKTKDTAEKRVQALAELAEANGMGDMLTGWVSAGTTVDAAREEVILAYAKKSVATPTYSAPAIIVSRGDSTLAKMGKDALAARLVDKPDTGRETELNREVERTSGYGAQHGGVVVPWDALGMAPTQTRTVTSGSSPGSQLIQTDILELIPPLTANANLLVELGATVMGGLQGDVSFPRITSDGAAVFVAETAGSDQAAVDPSMDAVAMSPKDIISTVIVSRRSAVQAQTVDVVTTSLSRAISLKITGVGIEGGGSNEPDGIFEDASANTIALATDGAVMDFGDWVNLETEAAIANADIPGRMSILTNPQMRGLARQLDKSTSTAQFVWGSDNTVNGTPAFVSTQIPSDLSKGTETASLSGVILGNFSELLIGSWGGGIELVVDPYTLARQGKIVVTGYALMDIALRHGDSFSVIKDAKLS